jgi:hypothetical protein
MYDMVHAVLEEAGVAISRADSPNGQTRVATLSQTEARALGRLLLSLSWSKPGSTAWFRPASRLALRYHSTKGRMIITRESKQIYEPGKHCFYTYFFVLANIFLRMTAEQMWLTFHVDLTQ